MKKTITSSWDSLVKKLENRFGGGLDLQSILFLIGIQELGKGYQKLKKRSESGGNAHCYLRFVKSMGVL